MAVIEYLCDCPDYAGNVSRWLYDEFVHEEGDGLEYEVFHSYFLNNSKTRFPIRLVAVADGKCVGTVTFIDNDFPGKDYIPWLGGLYVDSPHRNNGIGRSLIEAVKKLAVDMGYSEIYLNTENAGKYYQKLGWRFVESCPNESGRNCEIYKCDLV